MPEDGGERSPLRVATRGRQPSAGTSAARCSFCAGVAIAGRCLDGPSLADRASGFDYDIALVASDLHRLSPTTLSAIREARLPVVLLVLAGDVDRFSGLAHLVPADANPAEIAKALNEAWSRGANYPVARPHEDSPPRADEAGIGPTPAGEAHGNIIAVLSGKGAPGVTTVAIGLAAALGERRRRAVLDRRRPSRRQRRGLSRPGPPPRAARAGLRSRRRIRSSTRIEDELQDAPGFSALAGVEHSDSRSQISAELLSAVLAALRSRFEHVVVDLGEVISGMLDASGRCGCCGAARRCSS